MKKLYILVVIALCATSCYKDIKLAESDPYQIPTHTDTLQTQQINTLAGQLSALQKTEGELASTAKDLQNLIENLADRVAILQAEVDDANKRMDELQKALEKEYLDQIKEMRDEIAAYKAECERQIRELETSIKKLKEKDEEIQKQLDAIKKQISELKDYIEKTDKDTREWANKTFGTVEIQNQMQSTLAAIQAIINALDGGIEGLEQKLIDKINADIASCEESMKNWVNAQLTGYYKKAEVDGKIAGLQQQIDVNKAAIEALKASEDELAATLRAEMEAKNAAMQAQIDSLRGVLDSLEEKITAAYKKAIEDAISQFEGEISAEIQAGIDQINTYIDSQIATLNGRLDDIEERMDALREELNEALAEMAQKIQDLQDKLDELLGRIQSVSYIPEYTSGESTLFWNNASGSESIAYAKLYFMVSPSSCAGELASVWKEAIKMRVAQVGTGTGVAFTEIPVIGFDGNEATGVVEVTVDASENVAAVRNGRSGLTITNGPTDISTDFNISFVVKSLSINQFNASANCYVIPSSGMWAINAVKGNSSEKVEARTIKILWQEGTIVRDPFLTAGGKIVFTSTTSRGNALLAACDASGKVLWSWHIWATETPSDIRYPDGRRAMDRNIGATSAYSGPTSYGLYYQWGRKDPLKTGAFTTVASSSYTGNVEYASANPTVFITSTSGDWMQVSDSDLWGNGYGVAATSVKAVQDPCPAGYRVAPAELWTTFSSYYFTSAGYNFPTGYSSYTSWYPCAGYLRAGYGDLIYSGTSGSYHSSTPAASGNLRGLRFSRNTTSKSFSGSRADGMSVRCIKE